MEAGRYGQRLHFWNLERRELEQTIDLGATRPRPARDPLEARPRGGRGLRRRCAVVARCGASTATNGAYAAEPVVAVEPVDLDGWPIPVPGLITDLVLSLDDKALYFSNWLHGDLRRYDVSDPAPRS